MKDFIVTTPNPILRKVTQKVTSFDEGLKQDADFMHKVLQSTAEYGIGLAANQVGLDRQIFVVEFNDPENKESIPLQFFVNPEIVEYSSDVEEADEGCLSVPDVFLPVVRPLKVKFKAQDLNGKTIKLSAKGLFARLLQHETDHLNAKLFTDRLKESYFKDHPELRNLKIVYIGTGDFAEIILRSLILLDFKLPLIITDKAKPAGRNKELKASPVYSTARKFNKNVLETEMINELREEIKKVDPDLIVLADFGQLIPKEILDIPKITAINLHPSLLPKYRGPSPIQSAILAGEKFTGSTVMKMSEEIDQGEILSQAKIEILETDNSAILQDKLANLSTKLLLKLFPKLVHGDFEVFTQENNEATTTRKFKKDDGLIDWTKSPQEIDRQIRAFSPWPGSFTFINNKRIIIHEAHIEDGKLAIDIVQPEGKKPMYWEDFFRGLQGEKPVWFSKLPTLK